MGNGRHGRPRKDENGNGSISDDATYLARILEAGGNVSKAAVEFGYDGTRTFYTVIARLRKRVNGDMQENDPAYDTLYRFDKKLQKPKWTEEGIKLAKDGLKLLRIKRNIDHKEEGDRLRNIHLTVCKTPLYPHTEIVVATSEPDSNFVLYFTCRSCLMVMRHDDTEEFAEYRKAHPELYLPGSGAFF